METLRTRAFQQDVVDWILQALSREEVSWSDLLRSLPGFYPSVVLTALRELAEKPHSDPSVLLKLSKLLDETRGGYASQPLGHQWEANGTPLPVPHPLDFEWRFSPEAVALLLERCGTMSKQQDTIVLLGAPTLLIGSVQRESTRNYVLLDRNRSVVSLLLDAFQRTQVFVFDACQDPPPGYKAAVTVLDPPWYHAHFQGFLWTAAQVTSHGGHVLLSLPAVGTRPGIREERIALLGWAEQLGLDLVGLEEGVLPYVMPPFERNALRAAGLTNCPNDWRRGDLATFVVGRTDATSKRPPPPVAELQWPEVSASGVRIRFRPMSTPSSSSRDFSLRTIVPGDILPSVSSRDRRRRLATVWTSGNRVFQSGHPLLLRASLKAYLSAPVPEDYVSCKVGQNLSLGERRQLGQALSHLLDAIRTEQDEYGFTVKQ